MASSHHFEWVSDEARGGSCISNQILSWKAVFQLKYSDLRANISFNPPWRAIFKTLGRNWGMAHSNRALSVWSDQQRPQLGASCVSAGQMKVEGNFIKYLHHLCSMHICCCNYLNKLGKKRGGPLSFPIWTPGDLYTHVKSWGKYLQLITTAYAVS